MFRLALPGQNAKSECLLTVQRTELKFWSASSNPVACLASPNTGDSKKKNPQWVGKYKNFEMHYSQSPHISPRSPPFEEADDKCITCTSKQFHSLCKLPFVTQSTFWTKVILLTNAMTLSAWPTERRRLGFLKESEVWENLTVQHSAIDEEAIVVFCLAADVLQVAADDCWSTPRKMMSQCVLFRGMCHIS